MDETLTLPDEAILVWRGSELVTDLSELMWKRVVLAAERLKTKIQRNLSLHKSRDLGPSKPGQYPGIDTGRLRQSIRVELHEAEFYAKVGTDLDYGLWLEYGTQGGKVITAKGKALRWFDWASGTWRFAKSVTQGKIEGRSYLRRTLVEMEPELQQVFNSPIPAKTGVLERAA